MRSRKGFLYVNKTNGVGFFFSKSLMQQCLKTNFHNALTRVIQFECKHRCSYETTSFEKKK